MVMKLSDLCGISGFEEPVISYIVEAAKPYADKIFQDSMGNLYVKKAGTSPKKTVALFAHTDEVGLIVSSVTEEGFLHFRTVGGIDAGVLVGKHVLVGENKICGVIGCGAVHLMCDEDKKKKPKEENLYIDIGVADKKEAFTLVCLGDPVFFDTKCLDNGDYLIGKAFDDRVGCFILLTLMQKSYENNLYFVFTAQEETGLRGAQVAAKTIEADEFIVVENTTCLDMPDTPFEKRSTRLGYGPALSVADGASFANVSLREALKECGNTVQYKNVTAGGNDAGALAKSGKKVASISVPCRYLHSPVGVVNKADIENCILLLEKFLKAEKEKF